MAREMEREVCEAMDGALDKLASRCAVVQPRSLILLSAKSEVILSSLDSHSAVKFFNPQQK